MNLQSFEMEVHALLDGRRLELTPEAQKFMQQNSEAGTLYSQLTAIQSAAGHLPEHELLAVDLLALKRKVLKRTGSAQNSLYTILERVHNMHRARVFSVASMCAVAVLLLVWFWPANPSNSLEQDYEFYLQEHQMGSTVMLVAEYGGND